MAWHGTGTALWAWRYGYGNGYAVGYVVQDGYGAGVPHLMYPYSYQISIRFSIFMYQLILNYVEPR